MKIVQTIASVFGIGYITKGGGTVAAIFYGIIWWLLPASIFTHAAQVITTFCITALGVFVGNKVEPLWGKDSSKVVIDEVAGMAIALSVVPHQWGWLLAALIAFRFFDIVKPLGIRQLEAWPKGWGVMADDVLAGFYAVLVLWLLMQLLIVAP